MTRSEAMQKAKQFRADVQFNISTGDARGAAVSAFYCVHYARKAQKLRAAARQRRMVRDVYESLGMKRVRGSMGGVFYE